MSIATALLEEVEQIPEAILYFFATVIFPAVVFPRSPMEDKLARILPRERWSVFQ